MPLNSFLQESIGKTVLIEIKRGKTIKGKLLEFDQYTSLLVEDAVDLPQQDNDDKGYISNNDSTSNLGTLLIRGDNYICHCFVGKCLFVSSG